jgi:hypothetical protein
MIPKRSPVSPTTDSAAPTTSRRGQPPGGRGARDSGIVRIPTTTPAAMIGTFTRKIDPHQKWSSSRPPAIGPIASPAAPNTTNVPIGPERSAGAYIEAMRASAGAVTPAAPRPMTARAAMSAPVPGLNAAATEASAKRT